MKKKKKKKQKNTRLCLSAMARFYPGVAECCLALQISAPVWMDTGGLCWPRSKWLHPLRSAMQISPKVVAMQRCWRGVKKKKKKKNRRRKLRKNETGWKKLRNVCGENEEGRKEGNSFK